MAFPNLKRILRSSTGRDKIKLVLLAAAFSRPRFRSAALRLLRPFFRDGQLAIRYRDGDRTLVAYLREADLQSDFQSFRELAIERVYTLEPQFAPDVVVDGGGNIGMFSLRAGAAYPGARKVICEPVPGNCALIQQIMDANGIKADLQQVCLGGTRRTIPFYVREAVASSFDPTKPYGRVIDVPVVLLADVIPEDAERVVVKLDIEGMEIEALQAYLPAEKRAVCIHGELHDHAKNHETLAALLQEHGWTLTFEEITPDGSLFKALSPAALL
jgi:FkbM family methyltransferase